MLFLLKRTWAGALAGLVILALLGFGARIAFDLGPPLLFTWHNAFLGVLAVGVVLGSDGLIHGLGLLVVGEPYRRRHRALAEVFRGQSAAAILAGATMAGVGEEAVFRGLGADLRYLIPSAVVFGLLHHIRRDLWPFTVWAMWEGLLFVAALRLCADQLAVTMTAHFLHDLIGFLVFRWLNAGAAGRGAVPGSPEG